MKTNPSQPTIAMLHITVIVLPWMEIGMQAEVWNGTCDCVHTLDGGQHADGGWGWHQ